MVQCRCRGDPMVSRRARRLGSRASWVAIRIAASSCALVDRHLPSQATEGRELDEGPQTVDRAVSRRSTCYGCGRRDRTGGSPRPRGLDVPRKPYLVVLSGRATGERPDHLVQPGLRAASRRTEPPRSTTGSPCSAPTPAAAPPASSPTASCAAAAGGPYDFSAYNAARTDWPLTHLTSGAHIQFRHSNWAAPPGHVLPYITRNGWSPTTPAGLGRPGVAVRERHQPAAERRAGRAELLLLERAAAPGKTGRHIIYIALGALGQPGELLQLLGRRLRRRQRRGHRRRPEGGTPSPGPSPRAVHPHVGPPHPAAASPPRRRRRLPAATASPPTAASTPGPAVSRGSHDHGGARPFNGWTVCWADPRPDRHPGLERRAYPHRSAVVPCRNAAWNGTVAAGGPPRSGSSAVARCHRRSPD